MRERCVLPVSYTIPQIHASVDLSFFSILTQSVYLSLSVCHPSFNVHPNDPVKHLVIPHTKGNRRKLWKLLPPVGLYGVWTGLLNLLVLGLDVLVVAPTGMGKVSTAPIIFARAT